MMREINQKWKIQTKKSDPDVIINQIGEKLQYIKYFARNF